MNWEIKKLGDVCEFYNGKAHEKSIDENGKYKVVNSKFVSSNGTKAKRTQTAQFPLFKDDIVMVMSDVPNGKTLAKCFLIDKDNTYSLNQRVCAFRTTNFDKRFLFYQLNRNQYFLNYNNGENQSNLRKGDILDCPLFVPSIKEQQQIVAILDKAFTVIDKAKTNAQQNLLNAKELFESYLQNVFENKGDDWVEKTLGEVVDFFNGFAFKSKDAIEYSNTQVIRMGNLYKNRLNLDRKSVFYPEEFSRYFKKYLLKENDLIISLTGTTGKEDYGYTVKIPKTERKLLLNQRIAKFIIKDESIILRDLLFRFLLSRTFLDELYKTANGTRQANLSTETMKGLSISFPKSIKEQQQIVKKLNSLSAETKKLEIIYQQKINDLEELKKSVLQKAFYGELTQKELV